MERFAVDAEKVIGPLRHAARATGFTPARWLLRQDMRQTLTWVGSVPHQGVRHVRIHYLLDLVRAKGLSGGHVKYDWSHLDAGIDRLQRHGMAPFFELMGNPSGFFSDFEQDEQVRAWRRLVRDLAEHLMDRYGREEVESWYFECWNEPDIRYWIQPGNWQALTNYFDACEAGLHEANDGLRLGGAGCAHHLSEGMKAFFAHCDHGTNYFTGRTGTRLDFISHHFKGGGGAPYVLSPDSDAMLRRTREFLEYLRNHCPRLAGLAYMNNEVDPMVPWRSNLIWRGRPFYAAIITRILARHLNEIDGFCGRPLELLSNDNGFLGTWGNRSQLTRFTHDDVEAQLDEAESTRFALVRKPVLNVMALWAMQGEHRLAVEGGQDRAGELGVVASRRGDDQVAVLVYHSRDDVISGGFALPVTLELTNLPFEDCSLAHYRIGEDVAHPWRTWVDHGRPRVPDDAALDAMRRAQELACIDGPRETSCGGGKLTLEMRMPMHAVSLVLLTARPEGPPPRVEGLRAEIYEGLTDREEVMLSWAGCSSRAVRTYEVMAGDSPDGPFERINGPDVLFECFLHARRPVEGTYYTVRAVDYWGRCGEQSEAVQALPAER